MIQLYQSWSLRQALLTGPLDHSCMVAISSGSVIIHSMMKKRKTNHYQAMRAIAKEYGLPGLLRGYVHNGRFYLKIRTK